MLEKNHSLRPVFLSHNLAHLTSWLSQSAQEKGVQALYISSFDPFFNEYVPEADSLRFYLTGFTGSVAEMLYPLGQKPRLYVDGRYYEQADREVDLNQIDVVKVPYGMPLKQALLLDLEKFQIKTLGIFGDRTPSSMAKEFALTASLVLLSSQDLIKGLEAMPGHDLECQLEWVNDLTTTAQKLAKLLPNENEAFFLTLPESVAWASNARATYFPNQQTFPARALCLRKQMIIFLRPSCRPPSEQRKEIIWQSLEMDQVPKEVLIHLKNHAVSTLHLHTQSMSCRDHEALKSCGTINLKDSGAVITDLMAQKTKLEIDAFNKSFELSDRAIWKSLEWLNDQCKKQTRVFPTEKEWSNQVKKHYQEQGLKELSFKTIAGFGANSSVIHYSTPSPEVHYRPGQLALLDSGGHFGHGMCTDTTRAIMPAGTPTARQKLQYSVVLQGLLAGLRAVFPPGTPGHFIDSLVRAPLRKHGFEYAHGTGHGVGVAVHEAGVSFTPQSMVPIHEGRVGSIEPGIYLPGEGGIRLENIVTVKRHPVLASMLSFENFVWIGFQESLIDRSLFSLEELAQLNEYQEQCAKRGRALSF